MCKVVAVHSYRGGTGKSNLTANLAVSVASEGYRVAIMLLHWDYIYLMRRQINMI